MSKILDNNILFISVKLLQEQPFNLSYGSAKNKILIMKKEGVLYNIGHAEYLYLPTLYKYISLYGFLIVGQLISRGYAGLYTSAKKWGMIKQEHTSNVMFIGEDRLYKEYKFYYDGFKFYNYRIFKGYDGFKEFGLIQDSKDIIYSDKEKTLLDLIYYSIYSKYINIDNTLLESSVYYSVDIIDDYILKYPPASQNKILSRLKKLNLNYN